MELRTEELGFSAMQLDKVELCGRAINVGRPKGYIDPPPGARPVAALGAAQVGLRDFEGCETSLEDYEMSYDSCLNWWNVALSSCIQCANG